MVLAAAEGDDDAMTGWGVLDPGAGRGVLDAVVAEVALDCATQELGCASLGDIPSDIC